ncbi:MAG: UvrD-helicase domain-containing protein [Desulfovibrio sp.]|jgi:ATP-dependent exoDNAse (exonuclease V) beta subunit|nr:UvrD-helicase domain-containing protein [Desulfovibrio sp.]
MITRIKASAGAGKTYALTANFLELLEGAAPGPLPPSGPGGYSLREILAATFTNKAAAEMKDRLLCALKTEALKKPAESGENGRKKAERARQWVDRILRQYGNLNIRTIDSLLTTIVRLSALELGLSPDFAPCFDPAEYFTPHYDALMEDLAEQDADTKRFLSAGPAKLRSSLRLTCSALVRSGGFRGFTPGNRLHNLLFELIQRLLLGEQPPRTKGETIRALLFELRAECREAAAQLLDGLNREELEPVANYRRFLLACAGKNAVLPHSVYLCKHDINDCLKKSFQGQASKTVLNAFARASSSASAYSEALPVLRSALQLEALSLVAGEIYARLKETGNLLPAPALAHLAAKLLNGETGVSDAICRLGTRLSRIMLDEFQDTSRAQWEALRPLALETLSTGGGLWLVGDAKQAIYGWRGGEAELFEDAVQDPCLRRVVPNPVTRDISENWRSHPAIVAHNNAFFSLLEDHATAKTAIARLLRPDPPEIYLEQAAQKTAAIFKGATQTIPAGKNWDADPRGASAGVVLYRVEGRTAEEVKELVSQRLHSLFCEELLPLWRPADIAVLVRTRDEAEYIACLLSGWGIPVVTENSFSLLSHPLAEKMLSFLAFLDYPPDDAAFMEFISGPELAGGFAGHNPREILAWAARSALQHGSERPPLYSLFRKDFPKLWEALVEPFLNRAGLMTAYDLLAECVRRFDLERRRADGAPFAHRLLELACLAEQEGCATLSAFLTLCRERGKDEKLPLPENVDAVRIMTIHKAKGLEFPVVVLPFQHKSRPYSPEIIRHNYRGLDILTRATRELPSDYYPACVKHETERLDLLYVAWTRPIYALHAFLTRPGRRFALAEALAELCSVYREKHQDSFCRWEEITHQEDAGKGANQGEVQITPPDADRNPIRESPRDAPNGAAQIPIRDTPHDWIFEGQPVAGPPDPLPPLPWRPLDDMPRLRIHRFPHANEDAAPASDLTPRQRGILLHLCLERLRLPENPDSAHAAVTRAVDVGLARFPLPLADPSGTAEEMRQALLRFTLLPDAALWLAHGRREHNIMDEQGRMRRVDLLVDTLTLGRDGETDQGLLVLDYKSGRAANEGTHKAQVQNYMRLVHAASGRPVRGLVFYLDEDRVLEVEESRKQP